MLPNMRVSSGRSRSQQAAFHGLWHNEIVKDNHLYDMKNMCSDIAPAIQPRMGRGTAIGFASGKISDLFAANDKLCIIHGTEFLYDGLQYGQVNEGKHTIAKLGVYVVIFPEKKYFNTSTRKFGSMEATWTGSADITSYTYEAEDEATEVYEGNAIRGTTAFPFESGEAVFITGAGDDENNRSAIIRDVLEDGKLLVFTNNTFVEANGQTLTVERKVPDMDWICENENRLWGCKGSEIYASALGSPFRWNNFDGTALDSYAVSVGSDGDFVGAYSYGGYPIFFKEDAIHKMYGDKPSNFQAMESATSGLAADSPRSLAVAGELLFYVTRTGVVSYSGGVPTPVSLALGDVQITEAVGGSDGRRYYLSCLVDGEPVLYVYDTWLGVWHKEDDFRAVAFACYNGKLYGAEEDYIRPMRSKYSDETVEWFIETGDFTDADPDRKAAGKLQVRLAVETHYGVKIEAQYDSDGEWHELKRVTGPLTKQSLLIPVTPQRCDHFRVRISGTGRAKLYSITREHYHGTEYR